ncbi:MAG: hypothetical protein B7X04_00595 [Parcubacteria group bacterium 21-54-25]|nr:MAG: hypothetical protein B7X04_00595 [Parcubacteria group bacterium 21-54-25]
MLTALSKYPHPFLLYMQEDYFLKRPVSSLRVQALIDVMQKERAACLMLYPAPGPNSRYKNYRDIGAIRPGTPYRVSLQAGIWNTEVFTRLLKKGERGAEMEHDGSARSYDFSEPFLSVSRGVFFPYDKSAVVDYFSTGITKGRWHGGVRRFFAAQGVSADLSHRPVESSAAARRHFLKSLPFLSPLVRFAFRIEYKLKTLFE